MRQLSIEGTVALEYTYSKVGGAKRGVLGTTTPGVSLNYYF
jgi:hypothetical protein